MLSHKSGVKESITNYRPVSIQSAILKIFKSLVANEIDCLYFSTCHNGFIREGSMETNLLLYTQYILGINELRSLVNSGYMGFNKALDLAN